jgi:hypothetical protein
LNRNHDPVQNVVRGFVRLTDAIKCGARRAILDLIGGQARWQKVPFTIHIFSNGYSEIQGLLALAGLEQLQPT